LGLIALVVKCKTQIEKNKDYYKKLFQINLLNDKISETNFNAQIIKSILKNKKYLSRVHKEEFVGKFNGYVSNGMKQRGKNDKITCISQLILMFAKNIKYNDCEEYELGNIVLKKKISEFNKENKGKSLPLNFLGNLCLYNSEEEKRKTKETIVEYMNKNDVSDDDIYEKILYMGENIDYDDIIQQQEITEKYYMQFLKVRSNKIKEIIVNEYKKCLVTDEENERIDADEESGEENNSESGDESSGESGEETETESDDETNSDSEPKMKQPVKIKINKKSNNRVILVKRDVAN
jgi:hypothetical protein